MKRALVACAVAAFVTTHESAARADEIATACLAAHQDAQTQRIAGSLRAARDSLLACGDPSCPAVLREDCTGWLEAVDKSMPTVVVDARDRNGRDLTEVKVFCDGEPRAQKLDGKGIDVDPGARTFRFVFADPSVPPVEQEVVIREGEKSRLLTVRFEYPAPPPPQLERPVPASAVILGAGGIVGLGVAGVAFGIARVDESALADSGCAPTCALEDAEAVDRADTIAVIAGSVGVAALVGATVLFLTRPTVEVGVGVGPRSAWASIGAAF